MTDFSIGDRLLLHLHKYRNVDPSEYYNIPWDLTQDGIAASLRISRAHASIELKKHREKGNVKEDQVRVKGGKVKRKCYSLTYEGLEAATKVEEAVIASGGDVDSLLDLKRQNPEMVFERLSEKDRFAMGCACVFRMPVPENIVPEHERAVIPVDVRGFTALSRDLCKRYLETFPDQAKEWHSWAVEYWMDRYKLDPFDDYDREIEMLYHLIGAGRSWEACKIISKRMDELTELDDRLLSEAIVSLSKIKESLLMDVLTVQIEMCINQGWLHKAEEIAKRMTSLEEGDELGHAFLIKIYRLMKRDPEADRIASLIVGSGNVLAALMLAEADIEFGNIEKAKQEMENASKLLCDDNVSAVAQHLLVRAMLAKEEGKIDEAERLAHKVGEAGYGRWKSRSEHLLKEIREGDSS